MMLQASTSYARKIRPLDEIRVLILEDASVVLCHGVFDLVHPGHIRHLTYAKEKAEVLVVSITADVHINKGKYRPFVPEDLRALNLAALEIVDYVLIDRHPTPIETINKLRPTYFAKGYEEAGLNNPKTALELAAVRACGGEMLFTPGDVVYSSSHIIDTTPPNLALEKLRLLMGVEGVSFDRLRRTVEAFPAKSVHVIGDTIVDSLSYCTMLSTGAGKTPTPSVAFDRREDFVGGAAIVAQHLRAAGAEVHLSTLLGDDKLGEYVLDELGKAGVICYPLIDRTRPTSHKNAFVAGDYRLMKVDTLDNRSINEQQLAQIVSDLEGSGVDAFVFSDFRHGIFNRNTIIPLVDAVGYDKFCVADSQVASRWGNILEFPSMDLITPNEKEARYALGDQDAGVRTLAAQLRTKADCKTVMLKLGDKGLITCRGKDLEDPRTYFAVDSLAQAVVDPVGAGDALLAYATLALLVDPSAVVASLLGTIAAALACERDGNVPISCDDVCSRVNILEELCV